MKTINIKRLETKRLIIRKFEKSDAESIFEYASDARTAKYVLWQRHKTIKDTYNFLKEAFGHYRKGNTFFLAVELKKTGETIGSVGFSPDVKRLNEHNSVEVGYVFNKKFRGKGYCTEAVRALIDFAFKRLKAGRVQAHCNTKNRASARVMEKAGMLYEGTFKKYLLVKNEEWDIHMYSILRGEYKGGNKRKKNKKTIKVIKNK